MTLSASVVQWLLDADPALRWQIERDITGAPGHVWEHTKSRVPHEGWGSYVMSQQDPDGQWAGGAHFPAGFFDSGEPAEPGQPWTATSWSLKDLREWGVPASALGDTGALLARNCRWEYDDLPFWDGEVDVCINSYTLAAGAWLGVNVTPLARWFTEHRLSDGGWNCEAEEGNSARSSFHSTLNALVGLLDYEQRSGDLQSREARLAGQEYLLERRLMFKLSTGEVVGSFVTEFAYPHRHRYSALTALDYFRAASMHDGVEPDKRLGEAIEVVRKARQSDGTWLQGRALPGRRWVDVDSLEGEPSRWLTLMGTRVLRWWDSGGATGLLQE